MATLKFQYSTRMQLYVPTLDEDVAFGMEQRDTELEDYLANLDGRLATAEAELATQPEIPWFANAAARDAAITSPAKGRLAGLTDVQAITMHTGVKWIYHQFIDRWLAGPGVGLSQGVAVGGTVSYTRYKLEGSTCTWVMRLDGNGAPAGTAGSALILTVPHALNGNNDGQFLAGFCQLYDASANIRYDLQPEFLTSTTVQFGGRDTAGNIWGAVPAVGFTTSDQLRVFMQYPIVQ